VSAATAWWSSSGSTSISLALACAQYGAEFLAVMPEGVKHERVFIFAPTVATCGSRRPRLDIRGAIVEVERTR